MAGEPTARGGATTGENRRPKADREEALTVIRSIADIVRVHGRERADHVALMLGERRMTYGELLGRASQVAQALAAEGVDNQDRIALLDKNGIEHFEVFF